MFTSVRVFPGITHITDSMGVSFTLTEGSRYAVLLDTGYGMEDTAAYVGSLTDKPLKVFLSHGHHDHVLGARWFSETFLCQEDMDEFFERTGETQRKKVMAQASAKGVAVPADFSEARIATPKGIVFNECIDGIQTVTEAPGGITVRIMKIPGHTPGSIVIHIPEYQLLMTGDNWNPCTWMWFPSSVPADVWRDNMLHMIRSAERQGGSEIRHVLCSHQPLMRTGKEMKDFLEYMSDERMASAPAADMDSPINTHIIRKDTEDWTLVFDKDKV